MMMMICDMFYDDFMTRCISMPVSLNGTKHICIQLHVDCIDVLHEISC
jgi:hypothetical protein